MKRTQTHKADPWKGEHQQGGETRSRESQRPSILLATHLASADSSGAVQQPAVSTHREESRRPEWAKQDTDAALLEEPSSPSPAASTRSR